MVEVNAIITFRTTSETNEMNKSKSKTYKR